MVGLVVGPTMPDKGHADPADALEAMRDERLVLAHAVHSVPGAHR
ncbi:hypothetical protein AB0O75_45085 [Streptomyces sp. NPDC088921]